MGKVESQNFALNKTRKKHAKLCCKGVGKHDGYLPVSIRDPIQGRRHIIRVNNKQFLLINDGKKLKGYNGSSNIDCSKMKVFAKIEQNSQVPLLTRVEFNFNICFMIFSCGSVVASISAL